MAAAMAAAAAAAAAGAAAGGPDDAAMMAAFAAGGGFMSPTGSSMPAMTLPMSIGGGYDSSLTTPSSRAVLDMPLGPLVAAGAVGAVPPGARFSSTEVPDYAAAAAAAYAQGMGGLIMADPGMAGDMGFGAVLKDERGAGGRSQYQSGSVDEGAAGATSSGGRSGSPSGGRAWARAGRGEVRG
jgi:hypothetical protein